MKLFILCLSILITFASCTEPDTKIDLAGEWKLCLDSLINPDNSNPDNLDFDLLISLPSTLDDAGFGQILSVEPELTRKVMLHLHRKVSYIGPAYYQKRVRIPAGWENKHISLNLERVLWKSYIWVDGEKAGNYNSLSTSHRYDLSQWLTPGEHTITLCIDNRRQFNINRSDLAHAYTEDTQIKWNGVLGDISLEATEPSFIKGLTVYPYFAGASVSGNINLNLAEDKNYSLKIELFDGENKACGNLLLPGNKIFTSFKLALTESPRSWNEFSPKLYSISVKLIDENDNILHTKTEKFGFRDLETEGNKFYLNGEPIFLRGTLECCIFPLTGHPPLDEPGWEKVYSAAKEYGLNHIRFHSWCPPEVAFTVADRMGMYLQVELPNWILNFGEDSTVTHFIYTEADRIIRDYGNHPSFMFISMGNELMGDFDLLTGLVKKLKEADPRHLYTTTTYSFQKGHGLYPEAIDDYYITQNTEKGWIRGQGVFDQISPNFNTNYSNAADHIHIPIVSHEIGQYSVYPDMKEIDKYTGVLRPVNFLAVKKDLEKKELINLAEQYTQASGKFATLLYKEEIERAIKTPELSGFQLLDLQDFPGQGTALVGVLDAFWDSKGFVSGEEWRMFCSEIVPLLWFEKAVYKSNERFKAEIGLANYYMDLNKLSLLWKIVDLNGKTVAQDSILNVISEKGSTRKSGTLSLPLNQLPAPAKYKVEVYIKGTSYKNQWNFWLYPEQVKTAENHIIFTASLSEAARALANGDKVILSPKTPEINGITGKFVPVFWSPVHFPDQPGTMGLLIDPENPAFNDFPTDFYSNWQWWDLCKNSKTIQIDSLNVVPLVRVIDNFFKNRRLSNLFEASVGKGKMVFSSIDLGTDIENRPVARQLRYSLVNYMESDHFDPTGRIEMQDLISVLESE